MKTIPDEEVKIKMAVCPECKNSIMVSVVHTMDNDSHKKFAKHSKEGYDIITISLQEYREKKVKMYCEKTCKNY